jgi:hypothetical protein
MFNTVLYAHALVKAPILAVDNCTGDYTVNGKL